MFVPSAFLQVTLSAAALAKDAGLALGLEAPAPAGQDGHVRQAAGGGRRYEHWRMGADLL
jgi:hypothetical protein